MMFRSPKLLAMAKDAPACFGCGKPNEGDVVAAHANWSEFGKGTGLKAHDWATAHLCMACHSYVDQGKDSKENRKSFWQRAHAKTVQWLFETGRLAVK